jgi:Peptidase family S41
MNNLPDDFAFAEVPDALRKEVEDLWKEVEDLWTFLRRTEKDSILSLADMRLLADQALVLLEMFYVHMPLKRSMHAIDPISQLRLLEHRLDQMSEEGRISQLSFHNEMTKIFTSLRDLHTSYFLPLPYKSKIAFLPFHIEEYFEETQSKAKQRKYIVSRLATGLDHPTFKPEVVVLYWNGVPIEREIELNADRHAGSNIEASHARGLDSLTIRLMMRLLPPDEEWVVIGYRSLIGEDLELKVRWLTMPADKLLKFFPDPLSKEAMAQGIDIETDMIQQTKKVLFAPDAMKAEEKIASGEISSATPPKFLETKMPTVFNARKVETPDGSYAYIRIRTFRPPENKNFEDFTKEFQRLVTEELPQKGLIIDVRNNPGGIIWCGELLLQLLTPHHIKPEPLQFISTPLTYELCRRNSSPPYDDLSPWFKSLKQIVETGATFSQSFPLTPEEWCNSIGQKYYGPVVLITDALCYSTTDFFAAGFQDHNIGPILGTSGNTGAGGANVWDHAPLLERMRQGSGDTDSPLKSLPNGANMRVAIRRSLRVNEHEGMPLEDLGVVPDASLWVDGEKNVHEMTKKDLLNDNVDLINHAAKILAKMPVHRITADVSSDVEKITFKTKTENIARMDVFIDDRPDRNNSAKFVFRPQLSIDVINNSAQFVVKQPRNKPSFIRIEGFNKENELVAVRQTNVMESDTQKS